jgi:excisionase family DNA binding protein
MVTKPELTPVPPPAANGFRILSAKWDGRDAFEIPEVAQILGLSRPGAYQAAANGDLPVIRIGRRLIVPRIALERLLASALPQPAA